MYSKKVALLFLAIFAIFSLANTDNVYAAEIAVAGKAKVLNSTDSYLNFTLNGSIVTINNSTGIFSGYAWIDDIGYVAFGTTDNVDGPVFLSLTTGAVTGKAKVLNTGDFLYFNTNNSNVSVELATGAFSGHVWSTDVGWIDFSNTGVTSASFLSTSTDTSSNDNSSSSTSECTNSKPLSKSDLFQINTTGNSAKLFFTPLADASDFYISFSENANAEKHGEQVSLIREGVQSHTIFHLNPNTVYYAKVRGQNGCNPGDWSNIVKFKTDSMTYYKKTSIPNKILSTIKKVANNLVTKPTQDPAPISITQTNQAIETQSTQTTPETKKKCFLWWCW